MSAPRPILLPPKLRPGQTVALATPSFAIEPHERDQALALLDSLGLRAACPPSLLEREGPYAGTDQSRARELAWALSEPGHAAVWFVRGGAGAAKLLPLLPFRRLASRPIMLIGYSDITALLMAFWKRAGWVGLHAPVAKAALAPEARECLAAALMGKAGWDLRGRRALAHAPRARARLIGGNLSVLVSLLGTPFAPRPDGCLLALEEVDEPPYKIDRMLEQLAQAGWLRKVAGVALGQFTGCADEPASPRGLALDEVFRHHFARLGVPVVEGFPFGHQDDNRPFAHGSLAELDAQSLILRCLWE